MDLGFEYAGYEIELVNEFSSSFMSAYQFSRNKMGFPKPKYGYSNIDVNEYLNERKAELREYIKKSKEDSSLIGFIGGPPCPDFSIAGKQKGREGDNGKLSLMYVKLIIEQNPDFFLFENVKGLWRTAKHRAFYEELKEMLADAGYDMTDRLVNALEFGVPQDRERIMLFGIRHGIDSLADPIAEFPWHKYMKYDCSSIKSKPWPKADPFIIDMFKECPADIPVELTAEYWFNKNDVYHHPNSKDHFIPRAGLKKMQTVSEGDDSKKSYKRIHRWRYSPTVCYGNNEVHLHPYRERRLSVAEALALQSLPKEFILPENISLTDKFKTVGNGVPFLLSLGIAETIRDYLQGENKDELIQINTETYNFELGEEVG